MEPQQPPLLTPREINALKHEATEALAQDNHLKFIKLLSQMHQDRVYIDEFKPLVIQQLASKEKTVKLATYELMMGWFRDTDELLILATSVALKDLRTQDLEVQPMAMDFIFKLLKSDFAAHFSKDLETLAKQPTTPSVVKMKSLLILSKWAADSGPPTFYQVLTRQAQQESDSSVIMAYLFLFEACLQHTPQSIFSALVALNEWVARNEPKIVDKSIKLLARAAQIEPKIGDKIFPRIFKLLENFEPTEKHVAIVAGYMTMFIQNQAARPILLLILERHLTLSPMAIRRKLLLFLLGFQDCENTPNLTNNELEKISEKMTQKSKIKMRISMIIFEVDTLKAFEEFLQLLIEYYAEKNPRLGKFTTEKLKIINMAFLSGANAKSETKLSQKSVENLGKIIASNSGNAVVMQTVELIMNNCRSNARDILATKGVGRFLFQSSIFGMCFDVIDEIIDVPEIPPLFAQIMTELESALASDKTHGTDTTPAGVARYLLKGVLWAKLNPNKLPSLPRNTTPEEWSDFELKNFFARRLPLGPDPKAPKPEVSETNNQK